MKSKISFFNKTIFLKNVTLYWPIWVIYTLFLLGGLPVSLWFSMQNRYDVTALTEERMIRALYYTIQPTYYICVIAFAAVIIGMALFSYLYKSQSANMIHALPVDRTELFGTNVISGLVFLIVPQIFTFIMTILVCLNAGITRVEYVGMWLLIVMATAVIAFAFVTFCAFFTGQLVALPIYVVIINVLAYAFNYLVQMIVGLFGYGVGADELLADDILIWFSPIVCYLSKVDISYVRNVSETIVGISVNGIPCILVYLVLAIALYVVAYFVYRARKIESAGDLITVGIVKPIFRWGVGTLAGFYITIFFTALFVEIGFKFSIISFVLGLIFFGVIFYFVADMFVRKTFRVFKRQNWKGCGLFCIVMLLSFGAMVVYSNVEEKHVPKLEDVEYVSCGMGYYAGYEGQNIQKIIDIHEKILENIDEYEEAYWNNYNYYYEAYDTEWIYISYRLKNGGTISRDYRIPYEGAGKEIIDAMKELEKAPENLLSNLLGQNYKDAKKFSYGYIDIAVYAEANDVTGVKRVDYISEELTNTQSQKLYQAIIADGLAGNLTKYNSNYSNYYDDSSEVVDTGKVYSIHMEVYTTDNGKYNNSYDYYEDYNYINVSFGKDCVNIINAINELGLKNLDSAENIYWGEEEYKVIPEVSLQNFICYEYDQIENFEAGWLGIGYYAGEEFGNNPPTEYDRHFEIDAEQSRVLYDAIVADWLDGKMLKYNCTSFPNYEGPMYYGSDNVFSITLNLLKPDENNYKTVEIMYGSDCSNIIDALVSIGAVESKADICWEDIGWSVQVN